MAAGTHYDLKPDYKLEEFYRVETGVRKSGYRGSWILPTSQ
ncbi:hypothetical protein NXY31_01990 [Bacteroides salyersiae]|nr:hypothetical protein [Bacteroides salyersiae]